MAVKLMGFNCVIFCLKYGGINAIVDTREKYDTVNQLIKESDEKLSGSGGYKIGLYKGKLILGRNPFG
jgi:hypothetical protein